MKKSLIVVLALILCLSILTPIAEANNNLDQHFSYLEEIPALLMLDRQNEQILFAKGEDEVLPISGLTKLMTYYIAMDAVQAGDVKMNDLVPISATAQEVYTTPEQDYQLMEGESLVFGELLKALMVLSSNNAAIAIAEHVAGSEEAFVEKMNEKADQLGLENTIFYTASGLADGENENSMTARELGKLVVSLLEDYPQVISYTEITNIEEANRGLSLPSYNQAQFEGIDNVLPLATGAGPGRYGSVALMSYRPEEEDYSLIDIVLGAEFEDMRWRTVFEMSEYTAGTFQRKVFVDENKKFMDYPLTNANVSSVAIYPAASYEDLTYTGHELSIDYQLEKGKEAPIQAGETFGTVEIEKANGQVESIDLIAHDSVEEAGPLEKIQNMFSFYLTFLGNLIF